MKTVKFLDLKRNYDSVKEEVSSRMEGVLESCQYIRGREVQIFEKNFANYIGVDHCVGVGNGTDALEIAVQALDLNEDDEIIVQGNTFISTCLGVVNNGVALKSCDCLRDTFTMDLDDLERKITRKTKAVIVVHLYGAMPDMDRLMDICETHNLVLIEDTAQAHGATWKGRRAGSFGEISCFSFYPGKNLGAYGDGGAICIRDNADLAEKIRKIANLGSRIKYKHELRGRNSRLDSIQACILDVKLKYLDENNRKRRNNAQRYIDALKDLKEIELPKVLDHCEAVFHLFVIKTCSDHAEELQEYLHDNGIETGLHYPIAISDMTHIFGDGLDDPVAKKLSEEILSLPMYPELREDEIDHVASKIREFFKTTLPYKASLKPIITEGKPGKLYWTNLFDNFDTQRIFYYDCGLDDLSVNDKRGKHKNADVDEIVIVQQGSIKVYLRDNNGREYNYECEKGEYIYIPREHYLEIVIGSNDTIYFVMCNNVI